MGVECGSETGGGATSRQRRKVAARERSLYKGNNAVREETWGEDGGMEMEEATMAGNTRVGEVA